MSTEDICDECGLPVEECPLWIQAIESLEEIKKGNYKEYTLGEYIKHLHDLEKEEESD